MAGQSLYQSRVIDEARRWLHVREHGGANRGEDVERILASVGLGPGFPWCAAFVHFVHRNAAASMGGATTCPRTASATGLYLRARRDGGLTYLPEHVRGGLIYCQPGDIFVRVRIGNAKDVPVVRGGHARKGHTGIVLGMDSSGIIHTIEGNTHPVESTRDGTSQDGVWPKTLDPRCPELVGFVRPTLVA